MDHILGFFGIVAVDTKIEKDANQISMENFVVQGQKINPPIMSYKKGCLSDFKNVKSDTAPYGLTNVAYGVLHDRLVKFDIINKKLVSSSFFTGTYRYTINNKANMSSDNIKTLLNNYIKENPKDKDNELLNCFDINYNQLSIFLKNYSYGATDQFEILDIRGNKKGGKQKSNPKRKATIKRKNKKVH